MTPRLQAARRKKLKFRISCKSERKQRNGSRFSENMPLAVQWLVEKKSLLNEKEPDSREIGARRRNGASTKEKECWKCPFIEERGLKKQRFISVCCCVRTNKQTVRKTKNRPRHFNGLAERSLTPEFRPIRSINGEMAAVLLFYTIKKSKFGTTIERPFQLQPTGFEWGLILGHSTCLPAVFC